MNITTRLNKLEKYIKSSLITTTDFSQVTDNELQYFLDNYNNSSDPEIVRINSKIKWGNERLETEEELDIVLENHGYKNL